MPERLECEPKVLQKARYINTLTFKKPKMFFKNPRFFQPWVS